MSIEVKVPAVGESITGGVISAWHKKDGETVNSGDVLFTLETDKVATEVTAEKAGTLRVKAAEGAEVKIGDVVALIDDAAATASGTPTPAEPAPGKKAPPVAEAKIRSRGSRETGRTSPGARACGRPLPGSPPHRNRHRSSPKRPHPVNPVLPAKNFLRCAARSPRNSSWRSRPRRSSPRSTNVISPAVMELRARVQEDFQKQHGVKLGFMSFFIKAAVAALKDNPADQWPAGR